MPTSARYYRRELRERLKSEGFTYSLIYALGLPSNFKTGDWKRVIRQRLEDEHVERISQRTPRH